MPATAQLVREANIRGDAMKPCRELTPHLEFRQGPVYPEEDLLVNVLCIFGITDIPGCDPENFLVVSLHKLFEGGHIAFPGQHDQLVICWRHNG
jgi:hypothetical protein